MSSRALVTGATGQDGYYLATFLKERGYELHLQTRSECRKYQIGDNNNVHWHVVDLTTDDCVEKLINFVQPHEIYNLVAISSPALSWSVAKDVWAVNTIIPQRIVDALLSANISSRLYQAASSEIFGDSAEPVQGETTPIRPKNPYASSKAAAYWTVHSYRSKYQIFACNGILFNHESPRRPLTYVSQKICHAAALIYSGLEDSDQRDELDRPVLVNGQLLLGDLDIRRDFGYAPDYVRAMWMMLQRDQPDDYIVGTGQAHSIRDICEVAFSHVGLNWRDYVGTDPTLMRRSDTRYTRADARRTESSLGWRPSCSFSDLIHLMVDARIAKLASDAALAGGDDHKLRGSAASGRNR